MTAPIIDIVDCVHARGEGADRFIVAIERLAVAPGEQIALVGPSGCGKSTALDLLALVLRPTAARRFALRLTGGAPADILDLWTSEARDRLTRLRAVGIGYVLQTGGLIPFLNVGENTLLTRRLLGMPCPGPAEALLRDLDVGGLARRLPRQVSIGQRQRVAIARALAHEPPLVLADEPTASLDPASAERTMALLTATARRTGTALVVVTHDHALAERHGLTVVACEPRARGSVIRHDGPAGRPAGGTQERVA